MLACERSVGLGVGGCLFLGRQVLSNERAAGTRCLR
jgi:hypothetical protein